MSKTLFTSEEAWTSAYNTAKGQGDTAKQNFETEYKTTYAEYYMSDPQYAYIMNPSSYTVSHS